MKQLVLPAGSRDGSRIVLAGKEFHYLVRVRRIAVGEKLAALDGGVKLLTEVAEVGQDRLVLAVLEGTEAASAAGPRLVLYAFLLKARKLDDVIRHACEAGVAEIVPVEGDHCVSKTEDGEDGAKKALRWNTIAKEAAQQSGNLRVTRVSAPIRSRDLPAHWDEAGPLLLFHQVPLDKGSLHRYLSPVPEAVGLIIGPEGGISPGEVEAFRAAGALPVWLGPFVLRAETASLYAVAAVNTILQESPEWTIPQ